MDDKTTDYLSKAKNSQHTEHTKKYALIDIAESMRNQVMLLEAISIGLNILNTRLEKIEIGIDSLERR